VARDGILSGPIDLDGPRRPRVDHPSVPARLGLVVEHRATGVVGSIRSFGPHVVVLRDRDGVDRPNSVTPAVRFGCCAPVEPRVV